MPRLVIAEKPSVARDLARVLGVSGRHDGFYQGNGWLISWCIGHLVELCEPHEYNPRWKYWSLESLPMIPNQFRLRPIQQTQKQFNIVRRLLLRKDVSSVINACDAGREGELIFRYVYYLAGAQKPVQRLWISSMTDQAIADGFARLRPGEEFDPLWDAARCRSEADWLIGLNSTRAMTLRTRQVVGKGRDAPLLTIGRVQTPCLAMVVERELTIRNFVPQDYWQLNATFLADAGIYQGRWFRFVDDPEAKDKRKKKRMDRFDRLEDAEAMRARLEGKPGRVTKVETKQITERPPLLFDLTRLQRTANRRFGFSAAKTLELAQALYEKHKLLTYPRTDSAFLSSDLFPKMRTTMQAVHVGDYIPFTSYLLGLERLSRPRRVFNDAKVSDHHAIIPTEKTPNLQKLGVDERKLYDLVVRRFLAAFFPNALFERTTVLTEVDGESFLTRGRVLIERGWREVIGLPDDASPSKSAVRSGDADGDSDDDDETTGLLPPLKQGDAAAVEELTLEAKKTRPPPRYTEASLLAAMEGAGRQLDEEELQQAMKDSGLGTPATRASIIETLLRRNFIQRQKKSLVPTEQGIQLIQAIPVESLKSAELTGVWEAKMARIARGEESAEGFEAQVRDYLEDCIRSIKRAPLRALADYVQNAPPPPPNGRGQRRGSAAKGGKNSTNQGRGKNARKRTTKVSASATQTTSSKKTTTQAKTTQANNTRTKTTTRTKMTKSAHSPKRANTTGAPKARRSPTTQPQVSGANANTRVSGANANARVSGANANTRVHGANTHPNNREVEVLIPPQPGDPARLQRSAEIQRSLGPCPRCQRGQIIWGKRAWGCDQWRSGCQTTVPFVIDGYRLSLHDAITLLKGQQVGLIHTFQAEDGQSYSGILVLEETPTGASVIVRKT